MLKAKTEKIKSELSTDGSGEVEENVSQNALRDQDVSECGSTVENRAEPFEISQHRHADYLATRKIFTDNITSSRNELDKAILSLILPVILGSATICNYFHFSLGMCLVLGWVVLLIALSMILLSHILCEKSCEGACLRLDQEYQRAAAKLEDLNFSFDKINQENKTIGIVNNISSFAFIVGLILTCFAIGEKTFIMNNEPKEKDYGQKTLPSTVSSPKPTGDSKGQKVPSPPVPAPKPSTPKEK